MPSANDYRQAGRYYQQDKARRETGAPTMSDTLADAIIARLTDEGDWVAVDGFLDLAPTSDQPVYAYRHELDDADSGETAAFGDDATGLASSRPVRIEQRPDRRALVTTLMRLRDQGRVEQGDRHGKPAYWWRLAGS